MWALCSVWMIVDNMGRKFSVTCIAKIGYKMKSPSPNFKSWDQVELKSEILEHLEQLVNKINNIFEKLNQLSGEAEGQQILAEGQQILAEEKQILAEEKQTLAEEKRAIFQRLRCYRETNGLGCLKNVAMKTAHRKRDRVNEDTLRNIVSGLCPKMEIYEWRKITRALNKLNVPISMEKDELDG